MKYYIYTNKKAIAMQKTKALLRWTPVLLGIASGIFLAILTNEGPILTAFSGLFLGAIIYVATLLFQTRNAQETSFEVQNEERHFNKNKESAVPLSQKREQARLLDTFHTPFKTR